MADQPNPYAIVFDPENGFQLLNLATDEVADLAVLEGTWRKRGEPTPVGHDVEGHGLPLQGQPIAVAQPANVQFAAAQPLNLQRSAILQYGALRIRSTVLGPYAIADPRVSLRDDQSQQT